jgi:hypothetical protein
VIVEADEGFLLGDRTISSGPVFDTFFDALGYMNAVIESNLQAKRQAGDSLSSRGW